ncbi:MAG: hypothetical protein K1X87_06260 [Dehalococcoidia bacterium]|nr:hypothetical protein [Dehalococcoidia bacterium]
MTPERSRQVGKALMALSVVQVLLFLIATMRRSYAALAIPVFLGVTIVSGLGFWVGWTMSAADWDAEE